MKKAAILILVVVVLAVGGWVIFDNNSKPNNNSAGGSNTNPTPNSNQSTPSTGTINITENMIFTPSQISIQKGGTVTWTNNDDETHTVINDLSNVGGPASGNIEPGESYSFTFNNTGSFQYHCSIHPAMRGTIVVQ